MIVNSHLQSSGCVLFACLATWFLTRPDTHIQFQEKLVSCDSRDGHCYWSTSLFHEYDFSRLFFTHRIYFLEKHLEQFMQHKNHLLIPQLLRYSRSSSLVQSCVSVSHSPSTPSPATRRTSSSCSASELLFLNLGTADDPNKNDVMSNDIRKLENRKRMIGLPYFYFKFGLLVLCSNVGSYREDSFQINFPSSFSA